MQELRGKCEHDEKGKAGVSVHTRTRTNGASGNDRRGRVPRPNIHADGIPDRKKERRVETFKTMAKIFPKLMRITNTRTYEAQKESQLKPKSKAIKIPLGSRGAKSL